MYAADFEEIFSRFRNGDLSPKDERNTVFLGLIGEYGEICDEYKKVIGHGHPINKDKFAIEIADFLFYLSWGLKLYHGSDFTECLESEEEITTPDRWTFSEYQNYLKLAYTIPKGLDLGDWHDSKIRVILSNILCLLADWNSKRNVEILYMVFASTCHLANHLEIDLNDACIALHEKLWKRYGEKFSTEASLSRA